MPERATRSITPGDYTRLERLLASRPHQVLREFGRLQIHSLADLDGYRSIAQTQPEAAARIRLVAAALGISEGQSARSGRLRRAR